jgi:hypothetical protein
MFAQQGDVAAIGAKENVKGVAGQGHRADYPFKGDIGGHARQQKSRHAEPMRFIK